MTAFLDWFEDRLIEDVSIPPPSLSLSCIPSTVYVFLSLVQGKVGEKRALDKARSIHARIRSIEMVRDPQ